jgi:tetratricopeptide (TPR) repeat protein
MPLERWERNSKLGELFGILLQRDELDKAGLIAAEYREPENQARSLIALAQAWRAANQPQRAIALLTTAFQVAKTVSDPEVKKLRVREDLEVEDDNDRASLLEAIARLYAQVGEVNAALQVAQRIQDPKIREPLQQQVRCYR